MPEVEKEGEQRRKSFEIERNREGILKSELKTNNFSHLIAKVFHIRYFSKEKQYAILL